MTYDNDRIVTVASVKLTEQESALISAWCKLAGTKVEALSSSLVRYFIQEHVKLKLQDSPDDIILENIIKDFAEDEGYNETEKNS